MQGSAWQSFAKPQIGGKFESFTHSGRLRAALFMVLLLFGASSRAQESPQVGAVQPVQPTQAAPPDSEHEVPAASILQSPAAPVATGAPASEPPLYALEGQVTVSI